MLSEVGPLQACNVTSPHPVSRPASPTSRLSVSPIRPVKSPITARKQVAAGADVLPPWKQGDYVAEASYTSMTSMTSSTVTQLGQEQRWEQQVTGVKQVREGLLGVGGSIPLSGGQRVQGAV